MCEQFLTSNHLKIKSQNYQTIEELDGGYMKKNRFSSRRYEKHIVPDFSGKMSGKKAKSRVKIEKFSPELKVLELAPSLGNGYFRKKGRKITLLKESFFFPGRRKKIKDTQKRIQQGFYNRPEVLEKIAERLSRDLGF